ncbi:J domain-containing protein [Salinibacter sp.]|uniref:J domain-containing protein n=1 Tax=Salinibacter sp. TaxID=2065818 RepID=UPI0021E87B19|nr:CFI-box-CTERM domain-containing protein [Salinibacter sp.]
MTGSQSHYDTLGVSEDASEEEIKEAFFELVREHPPEQDPDAYQRLREAYDVLSDPVSRREYDTMAQHGDEIESLQEEAEALLYQDQPDPQAAIKKLKRASVLGPDISLLRNMLGEAYLLDDQPKKSLDQFDEAVDLNPDNEAHHLNRGYALRELERFKEAERVFRKVWEDNKGDYPSARGLASVLFGQECTEEAHEVLDQAIWADDRLDFEDFFCYFDKLQYYAYQGKVDTLEEELETVKELPETLDDRRYAAFMLATVSDDLREAGAFSLSHRFLKTAHELDDGSLELGEAVEQDKELREAEEDIEAILDSENIEEIVAHLSALNYDFYVGSIKDTDYEDEIEEITNALDRGLDVSPHHYKIVESAKRVRDEYEVIYKINEDIYDAIINAPKPRFDKVDCPHCGEEYVVEKKPHDWTECPHCNGRADSSGNPTQNTSGGCFVATAVYGDYDHPDVRRLRRFRDETLRHAAWGRMFIAWYYRYGPGLAKRLKGHQYLKRSVRWTLARFVNRWLR